MNDVQVATLGIVLENEKVLLGRKKKGEIGVGVLSGPGGRLEPGETPEGCLVRETEEEFGLEIDSTSLELVAEIIFYRGRTRFILLNRFLNVFNLGGVADFKVFVYHSLLLPRQRLDKETEDMVPSWWQPDKLPYGRMYEADRYWMPTVIAGSKIRAKVYYLARAKKFDYIKVSPLT